MAVILYQDGGSRVFSKIWSMFGGMCIHVGTATIYTFTAEGPDRRLWLYFGGERSEDGFEWSGGLWIPLAERVGGVIEILPENRGLGDIEGNDFVISSYAPTLLRESVLEQLELETEPPNPFRITG